MKIPDTKNIIFDFDGVIADTDKGRYLVLEDILHNYSIQLSDFAGIKDLEGISTQKFLEEKFPYLEKDYRDIIELRHSIYLKNLNKYCISYPGAIKTIKLLSKHNWSIYLATTNSKEMADILLSHLKIKDYFMGIFGHEITEIKETRLKIYEPVLNKLQFNHNECIIVEDSIIGVKAAKRANAFCIAFDHYNSAYIQNVADILIHDYTELQYILKLI